MRNENSAGSGDNMATKKWSPKLGDEKARNNWSPNWRRACGLRFGRLYIVGERFGEESFRCHVRLLLARRGRHQVVTTWYLKIWREYGVHF